jgi:hypothetical protein
MIKYCQYLEIDIDDMKFNRYARLLKSEKVIKKIKARLKARESYSYTLFEDDTPVAIMSFQEQENDCYDCLMIASDFFTVKHAVAVKRFMNNVALRIGAKKVITASENCPELNRWHEFLGFTLEKENDFEYRKIKHNIWSKSWEQE